MRVNLNIKFHDFHLPFHNYHSLIYNSLMCLFQIPYLSPENITFIIINYNIGNIIIINDNIGNIVK